MDILTSSYASRFKTKILTMLASVIGQFCNNEEYRDLICTQFPQAIHCLLYIFDVSDEGGALVSKVMFCLKMLCANSPSNKALVGPHVIPKLCSDMVKAHCAKASDFIVHGMQLL